MKELENKTIKKAVVEERSHNGEEIFCLFLTMTDGTRFLIQDFEEISLLRLKNTIN